MKHISFKNCSELECQMKAIADMPGNFVRSRDCRNGEWIMYVERVDVIKPNHLVQFTAKCVNSETCYYNKESSYTIKSKSTELVYDLDHIPKMDILTPNEYASAMMDIFDEGTKRFFCDFMRSCTRAKYEPSLLRRFFYNLRRIFK